MVFLISKSMSAYIDLSEENTVINKPETRLDNFCDIYNRYGQMLYHICLNYLKRPSDDEDAVQEVFLRYFDRNPLFTSEEHQKAWLIRTAINYCKDQYKGFWHKHVNLLETETRVVPFFTDSGLVGRIQQAQTKRNQPTRRTLGLKPILATGLVTLLLVVSSCFLLKILLDGQHFQPTQNTSTPRPISDQH